MNARESLAADGIAEVEYGRLRAVSAADSEPAEIIAAAVSSIAAELRAARVYANYLEGRTGARSSGKRDQPTAIFRREP